MKEGLTVLEAKVKLAKLALMKCCQQNLKVFGELHWK